MSLFQIYMLFFGVSTVIGVPLLSSFQVTQIKGSTWGDWVSGLGASLGPAAGIFIVITIITYIMMKPLLDLIKKAETQPITKEEQESVDGILRRIKVLTTIALMAGYPLGNGITIIIKTVSGKVNYNTTDLVIIMILILLYGFMAVQYSVKCFAVLSRRELYKLKIISCEGFKRTTVSMIQCNTPRMGYECLRWQGRVRVDSGIGFLQSAHPHNPCSAQAQVCNFHQPDKEPPYERRFAQPHLCRYIR